MTLCPIALAAGCTRCPIFKLCPAKGIIGNYQPAAAETPSTNDSSGSNAGTD